MDEKNENLISVKVVLVGDSGVGKTSIIKQFTDNKFEPDNTSPSIASQYSTKLIDIEETGKKIKFDLWDTAGQEVYRSLAKIFYKDANIIILVYDITSQKSFEGIEKYWYNHIKSTLIHDSIIALVGNKNDLYNEQIVEDEEARKYAESINALFYKISAKSNSGLNLLFQILGRKFIEPNFDYKKYEEEEKKSYNEKIENEKKEKKEKKIKRNKKDTIETDNEFDTDFSIDSIKLYRNIGNKKNKKLCC